MTQDTTITPLSGIASPAIIAASGQLGSLRRGFSVQCTVIGALLMRELHTRYGRDNVGYVWLILEPMMLAVMIALIHSKAPSHFNTDMMPVPLALIGYCNFMIFRGIFNRAEGALHANLPLLYHRTVSIFDLLFARSLLELAGGFMSFLILMGLAIGSGIAHFPERPLFVLLGTSLMFLLSFGLAMVVCAVTHNNPVAGRFVHPISYIMLPLSGAFVAQQWLPANIRMIFSYVPMSHVFEILRYGQFTSAVSTFIDWQYLGEWILLTWLIGLAGLSAVRGKIDMT